MQFAFPIRPSQVGVVLESDQEFEAKDFLIAVQFNGLDGELTPEQTDLSWSQGLKTFFQYSRAKSAANATVQHRRFFIPDGCPSVNIEVRHWKADKNTPLPYVYLVGKTRLPESPLFTIVGSEK